MIYVLDASAILRFTDRESGHERVRDLFYEATRGNTQLFLSAVNWGEIVAVLHRKDSHTAETICGNLAALPIRIVPIDAAAAADAGKFKWSFNMPYADAFAGSLAMKLSPQDQKEQAILITADYDFKNVPKGKISIEFLPSK